MTLIQLPDGRSLDLHDTGGGAAHGPVLLYHHGTPGSVAGVGRVAAGATRQGLRTVGWSRPGYGASTRLAGRSVADVALDAAAILDHLGVDRCLSLGWSGGGPHALATGALLPDRVAGVATIAGVASYVADDLDFLAGMGEQNVEEFGAALAGEEALRPLLEREREGIADTDGAGIVTSLHSLLPDVDRAVLSADYGDEVAAGFREGLRTGVDGWADDDIAFTRDWGFDIAAMAVPTFVWQGSADLMVPFAHGRWLAEHVGGATAHLLEGEGHLSVGLGQIDAILEELRATF